MPLRVAFGAGRRARFAGTSTSCRNALRGRAARATGNLRSPTLPPRLERASLGRFLWRDSRLGRRLQPEAQGFVVRRRGMGTLLLGEFERLQQELAFVRAELLLAELVLDVFLGTRRLVGGLCGRPQCLVH